MAFSLNKHKINEEIERHKSITRMNANLAQSRGNPFHFCTQSYRSLMLGYQKGKMAEKPQKNSNKWQRIVLKRLIIFLWHNRVSKNQEKIKRNQEAGNILKKTGGFQPKREG